MYRPRAHRIRGRRIDDWIRSSPTRAVTDAALSLTDGPVVLVIVALAAS
jgi:hypothetical protein